MAEQDITDGDTAIPGGVFWAAGWSPRPGAAWERQLVAQHQAGVLRLHDRGVDSRDEHDVATMRRWRASWWQDGTAVLGSVVSVDPDDKDMSRLYVGAMGPVTGWGRGSPVGRFGLVDRLGDPTSGLTVTGFADRIDLLAETIRDRHSASAVLLVRNPDVEPNDAWLRQTRADTAGALTIAALDQPAWQELTAQLPPHQQPPDDGARLYLPSRWLKDRQDVCVSGDELGHEETWRALVESALTIMRWNPPVVASMSLVRCLFVLPCNDEAVSGGSPAGPDWPSDDQHHSHTGALLDRLQQAEQQQDTLQQLVSERADTAARLETDLFEQATTLTRTHASRRRLATGVLRLRRERDQARASLDATAAGPVWRRTEHANTTIAAQATELDRREEQRDRLHRRRDWLLRTQTNTGQLAEHQQPTTARTQPLGPLLDAAITLAGIRFGPAVDRNCTVNDRQRRRCWALLEACSDAAEQPTDRLLDWLETGGFPTTLLHRCDHTAPQFPIDQHHWTTPDGRVQLDHTGDRSVYVATDRAEQTIHILYWGQDPT